MLLSGARNERPEQQLDTSLILFFDKGISGRNQSHQKIEKGHVMKVANRKANNGLLPLLCASLDTQKILSKNTKAIPIISMGGPLISIGLPNLKLIPSGAVNSQIMISFILIFQYLKLIYFRILTGQFLI
jgi:hypothetical protein